MPLVNGLSAVRSGAFDNLILDAGVIYMNINVTELELGGNTAWANAIDPDNTWTDPNGDVVTPTLLGLTRGGTRFDLGKTERQVEFDSRRIPVKGNDRIDMVEPKIRTSLLELADPDTIDLAIGAADQDESISGWTKVTPRLIVNSEDYIGNIALAATVAGADEEYPLIIVLYNVRSTQFSEMNMVDKNEATSEIMLTAHSLDSDAFEMPVSIYVPRKMSEGYY